MIFAYSNNQGEFTVDQLEDQKKEHPMSAENVWEKSMQARRAVANSKVLRPLVAAGEKPSIGEFDFELEVDSGGSDDSELFKLLLKVCKQRN